MTFLVYAYVRISPWAALPFRFDLIIFTYLLFSLYLNHYLCVFMDPGVAKKSKKKLVKIESLPSFYEVNEENEKLTQDPLESTIFCGKCESWRLPMTHHCSVCGVCVNKMDHHCPWVFKCVGIKTQRYFAVQLFSASLVSIFGLIISYPLYKAQT